MSSEWGTDGLVPGLKIRMTSAELRTHFLARSQYHAKRRDEKQSFLPQLEDAVAKLKANQNTQATVVAEFNKLSMISNNYRFDGENAVEQLKQDIENHNNKAVAFKFFSEHLFGEDYCLERRDLVELEILK